MSGTAQVEQILAEALAAVETASSLADLEAIEIKYLARKGLIPSILKSLKDLPLEERKAVGAAGNDARIKLEEAIASAKNKFQEARPISTFDPTLPGIARRIGARHLVNQVIDDICESFHGMGFTIARGPDIETDYYNFEALNFPPDHPARDMQDTFYLENGLLLRTHTTPVQVRELERSKPPVKIITPGRTYRNEAISTRSYCVFHQVDGFLVDEGVTMADLKGVLVAFCRDFYGEGLKLRFRPSFFPFTEPSAEVDISCFLCGGKGCQLCKYEGWLEILGCGMIDPNVLKNVGYDSEKYTGYAFGIGVERTAMLKYRINDIRLFYENDIRFIRQFK
ncbi:phenylalanine tRNA synthetase, alpha subunit [Candidatus Zixiibacteriota bacterium]|nr:phenylalanine tRNA synthetase, alpha subunit [candidate division Zixibacteria bacterium]